MAHDSKRQQFVFMRNMIALPYVLFAILMMMVVLFFATINLVCSNNGCVYGLSRYCHIYCIFIEVRQNLFNITLYDALCCRGICCNSSRVFNITCIIMITVQAANLRR